MKRRRNGRSASSLSSKTTQKRLRSTSSAENLDHSAGANSNSFNTRVEASHNTSSSTSSSTTTTPQKATKSGAASSNSVSSDNKTCTPTSASLNAGNFPGSSLPHTDGEDDDARKQEPEHQRNYQLPSESQNRYLSAAHASPHSSPPTAGVPREASRRSLTWSLFGEVMKQQKSRPSSSLLLQEQPRPLASRSPGGSGPGDVLDLLTNQDDDYQPGISVANNNSVSGLITNRPKYSTPARRHLQRNDAAPKHLPNDTKDGESLGTHHHHHHPKTPTAAAPQEPNVAGQKVWTPGGFQLFDWMQSVMSPFAAGNKRTQPPLKKSAASLHSMATPTTPRVLPPHGTPCSLSSHTTTSSSMSSFGDSPWREISLDWSFKDQDLDKSNRKLSIHLLDWSLKSSLTFQLHPATCGKRFGGPSDAFLQEEATDSMSAKPFPVRQRHEPSYVPTTFKKLDQRASLEWETGLLYWQHPAAPYSLDTLRESSSAATRSDIKSWDSIDSESVLPVKSLASVKPWHHNNSNSNSRFRTIGPRVDPPSSRIGAFKVPPRPRLHTLWQEAFRSLYFKWIRCIDRLNQVAGGEDHYNSDLGQAILETYFYACGPGQIALFRVGQQLGSQEPDSPERLVPEIMLSSSTRALREKLRAMGVSRLWVSELGQGKEREFTESMLDPVEDPPQRPKDKNGPTSPSNDLASPAVKAELMALRRAQVLGQTVGADVSVSVNPRKRPASASINPQYIPPICIRGMDDCAIFFELYFNTLGYIHTAGSTAKLDQPQLVPLLLTRKLGPFLHASLERLRVIRKPESSTKVNDSSLRVTGTILPCALRQLIAAPVQHLETEMKASTSLPGADNEETGSCHVIIHVTLAGGYDTGQHGPGYIGSSSSKLFNGKCSLWKPLFHKTPFQYCRRGEIILSAAWDKQRPETLAYKVEQ